MLRVPIIYAELLGILVRASKDGRGGESPLINLVRRGIIEIPKDREALYRDCKVAAELATDAGRHLPVPVIVEFAQREKLVNGAYVPDSVFQFRRGE